MAFPILMSVLFLVALQILVIIVRHTRAKNRIWSVEVHSEPTTPGHGIPRRSWRSLEMVESLAPNISTLYELFNESVKKYRELPCFGQRKVRRVIEEEKEVNGEKKKWQYFELTPYNWYTYREVQSRVIDVGAGLRELGLEPHSNLAIFLDTCLEWTVTTLACAAYNITLHTVYANLGKEALTFALKQGDITHLVVDASNLRMIIDVLPSVPTLKCVIYTDKVDEKNQKLKENLAQKIRLVSFLEVETLGRDHPHPPTPPTPTDPLVIMYTSGSTGAPKGVTISHRNVVSVVAAAHFVTLTPKDVYVSFLPMAHILAYVVQMVALYNGVRTGYGTPRTLTDDSVRNCQGDLRELRPTIMCSVPAIFHRIKNGAEGQLKRHGVLSRRLFRFAFNLKALCMKYGLSTFIFDYTIFRPFVQRLGGRMRLILTGGAPISSDVHDWMRVCFSVPIVQGYGLTETTGGSAVQEIEDMQLNRVGPPIPCCEIKLVDVPHKNYFTTDRPHPRGEIWIRGPSVTVGYYKNDSLTKSSLINGWFRTGDIGQWNADGTLSVIDREKNLIKPQHGEYISVEALEAVYRNTPGIENLLIYVDGAHNDCVAIVVPNPNELMQWAKSTLYSEDIDIETLCNSREARQHILTQLQKTGRAAGVWRQLHSFLSIFICLYSELILSYF
jgi:long-chain acyl-CoA synthetase